MRYRIAYLWFFFLSEMDLLISSLILSRKEVHELNPIANQIFQSFHVWGLVVFKATMVVFIIVLCETIGHRRNDLGRFVSIMAVALTLIAVIMWM